MTRRRPADLEAFAAAYPNAGGALAGRKGPYLEILAEALRSDGLAPPAQPDGRWPTFAGSPTRTRVVPGTIDVGSLQWRVELEPHRAEPGAVAASRRGCRSSPDRRRPPLAYHPIVLGDQVIVCDDDRIVAYDLNERPEGPAGSPSGAVKEAWKHDEQPGRTRPGPPGSPVAPPRFTLTAFGDRIYRPDGAGRLDADGHGRMGIGGRGCRRRASWSPSTGRRRASCSGSAPADDDRPAQAPGRGPSRTVGFEGTPWPTPGASTSP